MPPPLYLLSNNHVLSLLEADESALSSGGSGCTPHSSLNKQSVCSLEADIQAEDILNRLLIRGTGTSSGSRRKVKVTVGGGGRG